MPFPWSALVPEGFLISDAVIVSVVVGEDVAGVGFSDEDLVIQRKDHAGENKVVRKDGAFIHQPVIVGIFKSNDRTGAFF